MATLNMYLPGGLNTKACSNLTKKENFFLNSEQHFGHIL